MQTKSVFITALVLSTAVASHVRGQDRDAKAGNASAQLMPYVHHDFCAAVVIHPARIAQSEFGKSIDLPKLMAAALQESELDPTRARQYIDPAKIDRLTVLIEPFPGGNVAFDFGLVMQYVEDTPGREMLRALWPDSRASSGDERLFVNLEESSAGTPVQAYVAGPKTILIAPRPILEKMLSKDRSPRNPLQMQLRGGPADSEVVVEYASQPVLMSLLKLTGQTAAQLRADPQTDEAAKTMVFDVTAASFHLRLREKPSLHASVRCDNLRNAAKIKDMLDGGKQMLLAVLENAEARDGLKKELRAEFPPPVVALVDSPALKELARSPQFEQQGTEIKVKLEFPATVLELARRSAAGLVEQARSTASRAWSRAKQFEWKRTEQPLTLIDRDKGFAMLTGVQGRLGRGSEVSIIPGPDGNWTLNGTDHAGLAGRAVAVPWFVEAEQPVKFELWKKGEPGFPRLIHQSDGFCALLKIGGAFNGGGEQFRLRVGEDGYWGLNARSKAPGTRVRVMVVKLKKPGSFRGVVREHHWENGQQPVRLIHRDEGIAFLSGLAGGFQGGGEFARVRLDKDGYWYLEGRSKQRFLHAWATTIQLTEERE